jgi:hypothetical protein
MTKTDSLYKRCQQLFADYPLAAVTGPPDHMTLMASDGSDFFVLTDPGDGARHFRLQSWSSESAVSIEAETADLPTGLAEVLKGGVPCPGDGALFGWVQHGVVTGLIATYIPEETGPRWSPMPVAGSPEDGWPPFVGRRLLGHWFWDEYQARTIVDLGPLVASTPGTIYWAATEPTVGSNSAVVTSDVRKGGIFLPQGVYMFREVLAGSGLSAEALESLARKAQQTDLAPRFKRDRNR